MSSAKTAVALLIAVLISGAQAAELVVKDSAWLAALTIALAAVSPIAVWSTSNTKASTPPAEVSARKYGSDLP